jgi:hypothetical protein
MGDAKAEEPGTCVTDPIFAEVDEEVRREQLKQLWAKYGNLFIAAAVLVVLAVAGWRGYQWWEARKAAQAGAAFEAAVALSEKDKHADAAAAFGKVAADAPAGYRALARLREAAALAQQDAKAAVKIYDELAADGGLAQPLQDLARLRAGMLLVDTAPYDQVLERLEPLTAGGRTFRHTARELLAFSAWRGGKTEAARHWVDLIVTDAETPASTRGRIDMLAALLGPSPPQAKG